MATTQLHLPERHLRVGDAERQSAAAELQDHFSAGRLTWEELDERLGHAWAARTGGDLSGLFSDLPAPAVAPAQRRWRPPANVDVRVVLLVLLAVGLMVATRGIILIPVAWYFVGGRRHHHQHLGRYGDRLSARQ